MPSRTLRHGFSPSHQSSPSYTKHYVQELIINLLPTIATDVAILATATFVFFFYNWYRKIVQQQRNRNNKTGADEQEDITLKLHRFKYWHLKRATRGFSEKQKLGKGGFGVVYRGILRDGREVAIKKLDLFSLQGEREFENEISICSNLSSPYLVNLIGYCAHGKRIRLLVYEYMQNRSLQEALFDQSYPVRLDWNKRFKIIFDAAKALEFLHLQCNPPIIHGDIKPSNILLDSSFSARISDFGLARFKYEEYYGSDSDDRNSTFSGINLTTPATPRGFRHGASEQNVCETNRHSAMRNHGLSDYKLSLMESQSVKSEILNTKGSPHESSCAQEDLMYKHTPQPSVISLPPDQSRKTKHHIANNPESPFPELKEDKMVMESSYLILKAVKTDVVSTYPALKEVEVDMESMYPVMEEKKNMGFAYQVLKEENLVMETSYSLLKEVKIGMEPSYPPLEEEVDMGSPDPMLNEEKQAVELEVCTTNAQSKTLVSGLNLPDVRSKDEELIGKKYVMDWLGSDHSSNKAKPKETAPVDVGIHDNSEAKKSDLNSLSRREKKMKSIRRESREWWKDEYFAELSSKSTVKDDGRPKETSKDFFGWEYNGETSRRNELRLMKDGIRNMSKQWFRNARNSQERQSRRMPSISNDMLWSGELNHKGQNDLNSNQQWSGEILVRDVSSTSMRGTICYVAPEYGGNGLGSEKGDIYSFGVLILVILSGRRPIQISASPMKEFEKANLISWARSLSHSNKILDLVDDSLGGEYDKKQAHLCITLALLCLQRVPTRRPDISDVIKILSGQITTPSSPVDLSPSPNGKIRPERPPQSPK